MLIGYLFGYIYYNNFFFIIPINAVSDCNNFIFKNTLKRKIALYNLIKQIRKYEKQI